MSVPLGIEFPKIDRKWHGNEDDIPLKHESLRSQKIIQNKRTDEASGFRKPIKLMKPNPIVLSAQNLYMMFISNLNCKCS